VGPGEGAGVIDVGDGIAVAVRIESHNHPTAVEPYQGAATGVGGIIRDIFTMGARPIALLNSLRFGSLDEALVRRTFSGVVAGIAGYGNSIGIPTVGGEIAFDESYTGNPLVNVFCLGIAGAGDIIKGVASGVGNAIYYVGAKTGRDGIHGATMASAEFDDKSSEKRPAVQVGDPFMEKLLLEACLEVMKTDALVGIQDMGAAGLTSSTCEMAGRGGAGVEIDVSLVPQRETGMTPYEIMLSESQERMLLVVKRGREAEVERIFGRWDLHAVHIGEVTTDRMMRVRNRGDVVAEIPTTSLTDGAPLYRRPMAEPAYLAEARQLSLSTLGAPGDAPEVFRRLLVSPEIASKRWVYRQYDHMVRTNTLLNPGMGAGVVRVKGTSRALALSVDGNARFVYLDPFAGAQLAVAEAARNVACAGGLPIGATNCLNFGNPERPEIMWQFAKAVEGIGAACRALDIPVTGGNVSLYNETEGKAILPTPVLGVVGLIEDAATVVGKSFRAEGDAVVLLGTGHGELGGSEYLKAIHGLVRGVPPLLDLELEKALQGLLVRGVSDGLVKSAHDCAEGGLAVALAECCFGTAMGATADLPEVAAAAGFGDVAALFGESASRVVVSVDAGRTAEIQALARDAGVPAVVVGRVGGHRIRIAIAGRVVLDELVTDVEPLWSNVIGGYFESKRAVA
jgi:phosphoribosylformylglycinamidine synthase